MHTFIHTYNHTYLYMSCSNTIKNSQCCSLQIYRLAKCMGKFPCNNFFFRHKTLTTYTSLPYQNTEAKYHLICLGRHVVRTAIIQLALGSITGITAHVSDYKSLTVVGSWCHSVLALSLHSYHCFLNSKFKAACLKPHVYVINKIYLNFRIRIFKLLSKIKSQLYVK